MIDNEKFTTNEINTIQRRNLETALRENKEKLLVLQNDFEKNLTQLSLYCVSPTHFNNLVQTIKTSVFRSEKQFDRKRNLKLDKLKIITFSNKTLQKLIMKQAL